MFWCENILGLKKFKVRKFFGLIFFWAKQILVQKIFRCENVFHPKKILVLNFIWPKTKLFQNKFGVKNVGPKFFLSPKKIVDQNKFVSEKFMSKKILVRQIFRYGNFLGKKNGLVQKNSFVWNLVPILTTRVVGGATLIISSEEVDWDDHLYTLILTLGLAIVEILTLVPIITTRVAV